MKRIGFRTRLLIVLALFAVIPSAILTAGYVWSVSAILRELGGTRSLGEVATTGLAALEVAERGALTAGDSATIQAHRNALSISLTNSNRLEVFTQATSMIAILAALGALLLIGIATARVAGHLSRQLSRPLQELVGWTELIARGEKLPDTAHVRGAPEFEVLRQRMRLAARELGRSRDRALEAERLRAFRESARQVAHELKNMLTPIRFALSRLSRDAIPAQATPMEVLETEVGRIEEIARSFSLFGKLPEGPEAPVDLAEMIQYTASTIVPEEIPLELRIEDTLPVIQGHHDALSRALSNVMLNSVEACGDGGGITVLAHRANSDGSAVEIQVIDTGRGIPPERLSTIWDPYVTYRQGGTGLGLAITRQTVEAHGGTVTATSTPEKGTMIRFILPVRTAPAEKILAGYTTGLER